MKSFDQLLEQWRDDTLSPDERQELSRLLDDPDQRRRLVAEFHDSSVIAMELRAASVPDQTALLGSRNRDIKLRTSRATSYLERLWGFISFHPRSLGAAALVSIGLLGYLCSLAQPAPRVRGEKFIVQRGEQRLFDAGGIELRADDIIQTDSSAAATLSYPDGTNIRLSPDVEILVLNQPGKRLDLRRGGIQVEAAPQPHGHPLVISTPMAAAHVIGTRFSLTANPGATWLSVQEGLVGFAKPDQMGHPNVIGRGQYAVAALGSEGTPHPLNGDARESGAVELDLPLDRTFVRGDGSWSVVDRAFAQTKVTTAPTWIGQAGTAEDPTSTFDIVKNFSGSALLEGCVRVDYAQELSHHPTGSWQGCSWRVGFGDQIVKLSFIDYGARGVLNLSLTRSDAAVSGIDLAMDRCPQFRAGTYRIKLLLRRTSSDSMQISGKLWTGESEPSGWMVSAKVPLTDNANRIGFETTHCACTFERTQLSLVP